MKAKESVCLLLTVAEDLETKDMEKAEIVNAFLTLGPIIFSVFVNGLECTLSELVDDTRLGANSWRAQVLFRGTFPSCCLFYAVMCVLGLMAWLFSAAWVAHLLLGSISGSPLPLKMLETSFPSPSVQLKGLC